MEVVHWRSETGERGFSMDEGVRPYIFLIVWIHCLDRARLAVDGIDGRSRRIVRSPFTSRALSFDKIEQWATWSLHVFS